MQIRYEPRDPSDFPNWRFDTVDFEYDAASRSAWMAGKADATPYFSMQMLMDLANIRESLHALHARCGDRSFPVHYVVLASNKPGVYNLGGDLAMFARSIREAEREPLRSYAHLCINVLHSMLMGYGLPVITVAVIAGQALGGGFEGAMAQDFIFADESSVLGVPEVAFNTFPGMGAVTLLTRRIGAAHAEHFITDGKVHPAREMFDLGVIDRLAPVGQAKASALSWMIEGGEEGRQRRLAVIRARRACIPVSQAELIGIVDVWTDTSLSVTARDLRHMERLVAAQKKMAQSG